MISEDEARIARGFKIAVGLLQLIVLGLFEYLAARAYNQGQLVPAALLVFCSLWVIFSFRNTLRSL